MGEAIVDNVAVGCRCGRGMCWRGMCSLLCEAQTEAFYDLTELEKGKFNSCVISAGIIELKKESLI